MEKNLEEFTERVLKEVSLEISDLCMKRGMPPALATGVLATTLAIYCNAFGLTEQQAISKFTETVRGIYDQSKTH